MKQGRKGTRRRRAEQEADAHDRGVTPLLLALHHCHWPATHTGLRRRRKRKASCRDKAEEDTCGLVSESTEGFFICVAFFSFPRGHGGYCVTSILLPLPASCETEALQAASKKEKKKKRTLCERVPEWLCVCVCVCMRTHDSCGDKKWVMSIVSTKQVCPALHR